MRTQVRIEDDGPAGCCVNGADGCELHDAAESSKPFDGVLSHVELMVARKDEQCVPGRSEQVMRANGLAAPPQSGHARQALIRLELAAAAALDRWREWSSAVAMRQLRDASAIAAPHCGHRHNGR